MKQILLLFILISTFVNLSSNEDTSQRAVQNLQAFTKMYGYIRYFHPSDEAQKIDWDKFAVYGVSKTIDVKNDTELKAILNELFSPIAPTAKAYLKNEKIDKLLKTPSSNISKKYKTTFWQYKGLELNQSLFESKRTSRPFKIKKNNDLLISNAKLIINTELSDISDSVFISLKYKYNSPITINNYIIAFPSNLDSKEPKWEKVTNNEWNKVEFSFNRELINKERFCLLFVDANSIYLDSIRITEKINGCKKLNKTINFETDTPNQYPSSLLFSGKFPDFLKNVDYTVIKKDNNNLLLIEKSKSNLDYTLAYNDNIFDESLKISDCIDRPLNSGVMLYSPLSLYCDKLHTYPIADSLKLSQLINKLNKIEPNISTRDSRIAAIVVFWNLIQHFYPYFEYSDLDWENDLALFLKKSLDNETEKEFKDRGCLNIYVGYDRGYNKEKESLFILKEMGSKLKDSHFYAEKETIKRKEMPPFSVNYIKNKWIITDILDSVPIPLGSQIISYNLSNLDSIYTEYSKYFYGASELGDRHSFFRDYSKYNDSNLSEISVTTPDNKILDFDIDSRIFNPNDLDLKKDSVIVYPDSLLYLNINKGRLNDNDIKKMLPLMMKAKGIIFDLRLYPNVNTDILTYLIKDKIDIAWGDNIHTIFPDRFPLPVKHEMQNNYLYPDSLHLNAKCVFLSGDLSQSYCETYLSIAKYNKLATIIGSRTNASNGTVLNYKLPSDIDVQWTGYFIKNFDGSRFHGIGVIPDIEVYPTIKGISEGRDEILEKALEYLRQFK